MKESKKSCKIYNVMALNDGVFLYDTETMVEHPDGTVLRFIQSYDVMQDVEISVIRQNGIIQKTVSTANLISELTKVE